MLKNLQLLKFNLSCLWGINTQVDAQHSVILLPLHPASLTHRNPQRPKIIHGMLPVGHKHRLIDFNMCISRNIPFIDFFGSYYMAVVELQFTKQKLQTVTEEKERIDCYLEELEHYKRKNSLEIHGT